MQTSDNESQDARSARARDSLLPQLLTRMRQGYGAGDLKRDLTAGLTVAVVALPLAMAIGIASGATPMHGLITAIVAGLLISLLGGSNHQIGGPTTALILLVSTTLRTHGMDGLLLATMIAGALLMIVALMRLGRHVRHVPHAVIIGFTSGIAVGILLGQIKELLGIKAAVPSEFLAKIETLWQVWPEARPGTILVSLAALALMVLVQKRQPRLPAFLVGVVFATALVATLGLDADTISTRFGMIGGGLPWPALPQASLEKLTAVLPSALALAFLIGIESLLSCMIADRSTGEEHRPNAELMAQGIANIATAAFGGVAATGALARTATNIKAGAISPVSGIAHSLFLWLFIAVAAPLMGLVPLAALAAILALVAFRIMEIKEIRHIFAGTDTVPKIVVVLTLGLTVMVDLTVAIVAGIAVYAVLRRIFGQ
jgi:sulfate permease, SulP family